MAARRSNEVSHAALEIRGRCRRGESGKIIITMKLISYDFMVFNSCAEEMPHSSFSDCY